MSRRKIPIFFDTMRRRRSQGARVVSSYKRISWKRVKTVAILVAGLALAILAFSVTEVDQTEAVILTDFGQPVRLIEEPGLHAKWPWQTRLVFDRRLQVDAPPPRPMITKDQRTLDVAWYVSWKVGNLERFVKSVRTRPDASARLDDMASSVLASKLARYELPDLVRVGGASVVETMMNEVTARVAEQADKEYGLKVLDVRLRRLNFPDEVRPAVYEQIRSERQRVAAALRAEGESQARSIRSAADLERARALAEAEAEATRVVGEGEAQAARVGNNAYAADPTFYQFLKTLETYRKALDGRTTVVLSADSPFLRLLTDGVPDFPPPPGPPASASALPTRPPTDAAPPAATAATPTPTPTPTPPPTPTPTPVNPPVVGTTRPPVSPPSAAPVRSTAVRPKPGVSGTRPPVTGARP